MFWKNKDWARDAMANQPQSISVQFIECLLCMDAHQFWFGCFLFGVIQ